MSVEKYDKVFGSCDRAGNGPFKEMPFIRRWSSAHRPHMIHTRRKELTRANQKLGSDNVALFKWCCEPPKLW